jgi:hypothetical protein
MINEMKSSEVISKVGSLVDVPPKNWSKTNVSIGPIWRHNPWQSERDFEQNRSS